MREVMMVMIWVDWKEEKRFAFAFEFGSPHAVSMSFFWTRFRLIKDI